MAGAQAMKKDTRKMICSIEQSALGTGSGGPVRITDYQFLASYNWSKVEEPTIFIPGCPPLWTLPILPLQLSKDNHEGFMDQKPSRPPVHSFDPFFKSLLTMHPDFDMKSVSLVSNRNNLRKLLDFVCNKAGRSFRIDVDMIYDTIFLTRWEPSHMQLVNGYGDPGYGHAFERKFTTVDENLANSVGHHRIAQYSLGGMKCLVRFEADAYVDDPCSSGGVSIENNSPTETLNVLENDLSISIQSISLEPKPSGKHGVTIIRSGRLVPPASVVEMKSRSRKIKMADIIPQLWLSQTENLFIGYHHQGLIEQEPIRHNMVSFFTTWETQHEKQLQKFLSLILRIKESVQGIDSRKGAIIYNHAEKLGKLRIYETSKDGLMTLLHEEKKCWNREGK